MKKTLKQQNEHLSHLLEESEKSDRNGNIIIIGFAAIIAGLLIFATVQSSTISELEEKIEIKKEEIFWQEIKLTELKIEIAMINRCEELAEESNKDFYTSFGACRLKGNEEIALFTVKEIEDAIKHYQLGNKENKK